MSNEFYHDPGAPVQPDQFVAEFEELLDIYNQLNPRRILEIGVRMGGTLYQWLRHALPGAVVVAVDLPGGPWGVTRNNAVDWHLWANHYRHDLHVLLANSRHPNTVKEVEKLGPYDFVFIDGDHSATGVACDYLTYRRMVRPGGVMVLHDILQDKSDKKIEVYKYWHDIREAEENAVELISRHGQDSRGIGVIYV